jgi:DNA polymerase-1
MRHANPGLRHFNWGTYEHKSVAILVPNKDFKKAYIEKHYVEPLVSKGINRESIIAFNLAHTDDKRIPIAIIDHWLSILHKALEKMSIEFLIVCNPDYFKKIAMVTKVDSHYGYALRSRWHSIKATPCPNYTSLFYNPKQQEKIDYALNTCAMDIIYGEELFGDELTRSIMFPESIGDIAEAMQFVDSSPEISCDIETYSLRLNEAGIASIAFAWDIDSGVVFAVGNNEAVKDILRDFFWHYPGRIRFHGSTFDTKVLIWELYMRHPLDYKGMIEGLDILHSKLDDTRILSYLTQNTTVPNSYSLKQQAFDFSGNYALGEDEINNIHKIKLEALLRYNATDALATNYLYLRDFPRLHDENQAELYEELYLPALKVITQMELCGMPMNYGQVLTVEQKLEEIVKDHMTALSNSIYVHETERLHREKLAKVANLKLKRLRKTWEDFLHEKFNPASPNQLQLLLYKVLDLPVLGTTPTGQPSTSGKVLKALIAKLTHEGAEEEVIEVLTRLKDLADVRKLLNTFITAFKKYSIKKDGWHYLHGSFLLGGTVSGRLSSSSPNLQQIPSTGTKYAKLIKSCFQPPPFPNNAEEGWLMVGADFSSLEDRISALQTNDPNKLKIYTDGYDGHCLRAYSYFKDQMPDIDPNSVESINSIAEKYPALRQASKSPTFLLTYMGTAHGLQKTFGFSEEEATNIERNYHELYRVSDAWVMEKVKTAQQLGYAELAFGLKLRTPLLPQVILESDSVPAQAYKEVKTVGNALGQSYGLLNTRAANEFMQRVWKSEFRYDILPICQIHDSLYFMIKNTYECIMWVNENLIDCMTWNELPEIQHEKVKLEAEMEIYYPDWSNPIRIPNGASREELKTIIHSNAPPAHG